MDLELADKVFVVTGGTEGLGLATTRALLAEGARVLVTGRSEGKVEAIRADLGAAVERLAYVQSDNADAELPTKLRDAALGRWGRLDGLLVSVGRPPPGKALATDDGAWRDAFDSVFLGAIRLVRDLSPHIGDGGAIALVLAISAKEASLALPISNGLRPGLAMLVKSFAEELGPRAVRINALLPNLFATDRVKRISRARHRRWTISRFAAWASPPSSVGWRQYCCRRSPPTSRAPRSRLMAASSSRCDDLHLSSTVGDVAQTIRPGVPPRSQGLGFPVRV